MYINLYERALIRQLLKWNANKRQTLPLSAISIDTVNASFTFGIEF